MAKTMLNAFVFHHVRLLHCCYFRQLDSTLQNPHYLTTVTCMAVTDLGTVGINRLLPTATGSTTKELITVDKVALILIKTL
mgnify:CR=1 FL=1